MVYILILNKQISTEIKKFSFTGELIAFNEIMTTKTINYLVCEETGLKYILIKILFIKNNSS